MKNPQSDLRVFYCLFVLSPRWCRVTNDDQGRQAYQTAALATRLCNNTPNRQQKKSPRIARRGFFLRAPVRSRERKQQDQA